VTAHLVDCSCMEPDASWGQVALRIPWSEVGAVQSFAVPVRLVRLSGELPTGHRDGDDSSEMSRLLGQLPAGIRIIVTGEHPAGLVSELPRAMESEHKNLWFEVSGEAKDLVATVRQAGLSGWPVLLPRDSAALWQSPDLLDLLDLYLFEETLQVPIEPFHSMLVSLLSRSGRTLWNMWFGWPLDFFFIDEDHHVSLCASWASDSNRCYGSATDSVSVWRASEAHDSLAAMLDERKSCSDCESCPIRHLCGGALRAVHSDVDCSTWVEIVERLRLAAAALGRTAGDRNHGNQS